MVSLEQIVITGTPEIMDQHFRAWHLSGVDAIKTRAKITSVLMNKGTLDVCEKNFGRRRKLFNSALKAGVSVITEEPILRTFESSKKMLERFENENLRIYIIDPLEQHPLVSLTRKLITEGRIGTPRILRLNLFTRDPELTEFSLIQSVGYCLRMCELLFAPNKITEIYASKIRTNLSKFFAIAVVLENQLICHAIAGNSSIENVFEFAVNGTGGMLSTNEGKTLELPSNVEFPDNLKSTMSVEVLCAAFAALSRNQTTKKQSSVLAQELTKAVIESSKIGNPVIVRSTLV